MEITIIYLLTISLVFILLILFGAIIFLGKAAFNNLESSKTGAFGLLFRQENFLRIAIVLLIIYTVLAHSIVSQGEVNETIISILSGIAGFTLGGMKTKERNESNTITKVSNTKTAKNDLKEIVE